MAVWTVQIWAQDTQATEDKKVNKTEQKNGTTTGLIHLLTKAVREVKTLNNKHQENKHNTITRR